MLLCLRGCEKIRVLVLCSLSTLRSTTLNSSLALFYKYPAVNGIAHFISTYDHDGNPLPSFSGEPLQLKVEMPFAEFAAALWSALNNENKISLYVRFGEKEMIFNKNEGD